MFYLKTIIIILKLLNLIKYKLHRKIINVVCIKTIKNNKYKKNYLLNLFISVLIIVIF